jgi:hypothetical protein
MGLETETVGLEWDRSTAGKWVEHGRKLTASVLEHLSASFGVYLRMLMQLLAHHSANDAEEPFAFGTLGLIGGPPLRMRGRIVHH